MGILILFVLMGISRTVFEIRVIENGNIDGTTVASSIIRSMVRLILKCIYMYIGT